MAWHPCLGSTWSEFNSQFPDQFRAPVAYRIRHRITNPLSESSLSRFNSCRVLHNFCYSSKLVL